MTVYNIKISLNDRLLLTSYLIPTSVKFYILLIILRGIQEMALVNLA